jgi:DNA-binding transcriptional regulator YiaG
MPTDNIPQYIRALRSRLSLSTRDLAALCGVSHRTAQGWQSGRVPSRSALKIMEGMLPPS